MPHNFILVWLLQLLSVGVLGGGIYILYEWYERELVGTSYLVAGLVMVLWTFGGRFISLPLLRRPGVEEPKFMRSTTVQRLPRPDGSVLQVEFFGPKDGQPIILSHGWGPNSTVWYYAKRQLSDRMKAELPYSERVTIKPGGHMALMEQNQQFAEVVSTFCAGCSNSSVSP